MATAHEKIHIESSPDVCGGKPRITGSRVRVQDVVAWTEAGQSPDEIVGSFPNLTLADVYAALAYYHDHRDAIDRQIRKDHDFVATLKATSGPGLLARARGDGSR